jgi:hypothetical protein
MPPATDGAARLTNFEPAEMSDPGGRVRAMTGNLLAVYRLAADLAVGVVDGCAP